MIRPGREPETTDPVDQPTHRLYSSSFLGFIPKYDPKKELLRMEPMGRQAFLRPR